MSFASGLIFPVIMCGGSGTRLWPASRESMPKQFIPLLEEESTFQATARRVCDAATFARATVVTSADSRFIVAEQLMDAGLAADIVLEPMRRDSAAAVAAATYQVARRDPEAVILMMPADHVIRETEPFVAACRSAAAAARDGRVM